jgi:hypothetical protein
VGVRRTGRLEHRGARWAAGAAVAVLCASPGAWLVPGAPAGAAVDPVVATIAAVGDIACDPASSGFNGGAGTATDCRHKATAALLTGVDAVLPLGDEQYGCGGLTPFNQVYDPSWGVKKASTRPVPGNHEYQTGGGTGCSAAHDASGYFAYFGSLAGEPTKGYYSFDIGPWHIMALNSELCYDSTNYDSTATSRCPRGSAMEAWLRADLAAHPSGCKLAYWHEPRFSSTPGRGDDTVDPLWQALAAARADVVLTGHQHFYERFAQMNASGAADPSNGVRQFVVGTGGESLMSLSSRLATSQASNDKTFGVLKMTLHAASYDWQFVPVSGSTYTDSGSTACHAPAPEDTTAPTTSITCDGAPCSTGWYSSKPVSVALTATDTGGSGLAGTRYTTDGSDPATSPTATTYVGPVSLATSRTVRYASTDKAGNVEASRSTFVKVDTVAPATGITCNGGACSGAFGAPVTVILSAADDGGSGVRTTVYTTDGSTPQEGTAVTYSGPFTVSSTTTLQYFSVDQAGNAESTRSRAIQVGPPPPADTVPPTTAMACNGAQCTSDWYGPTPVTVVLSGSDIGDSGVAATSYTTDGTLPPSSSTTITYSGPFTLSATTTVRFASTDQAGNVEPAQSQLVRVDLAAPTTSATCNSGSCGGWFRSTPVNVALSAADPGGSGVSRTAYTTDGTDPATSETAVTYAGPFAVAATSALRYASWDAAGNRSPTVNESVRIDTVLPTTPIYCNGDPCGPSPYAGAVTVTLPATDAGGSGLARTTYTTDGTDPISGATATPYTGPFTVTRTTTVKAFSVDLAGNVEPVGSRVVQISSDGTLHTATLRPTDDSYTAKGNPAATHGGEPSLNVNSGSNERRTYLRFDLGVLPTRPIGVTSTLRLLSQSGAASTVVTTVALVSPGWTEGGLTSNNQPALGTVVTSKAGLTNGAFNSFDLSSAVTGNGTYAVALTSNNSTQRYFSSKESGSASAPQLTVSWTAP